MSERNEPATKVTSDIKCVEISVSDRITAGNYRLHWMLRVYSLENQPVEKLLSVHSSDVFHFMLFDWERTIQPLLDSQQIAYAVIRYFSPDTIYADTKAIRAPGPEIADRPAAVNHLQMSGGGRQPRVATLSEDAVQRSSDFILPDEPYKNASY